MHQVALDSFWIGECEVTNGQYRAFCDATGRTCPIGSAALDDHPAMAITWDNAKAYCDHYGYVLPTEAQWEYAAAGPEAATYPWGDEWDDQKCCNHFNPGPVGTTFPVGSFPAGASWCGALDMSGNWWEWCADWYASDYYQVSPESNPRGPDTGTSRVLRGGSCFSMAGQCRAAYRYYSGPTHPQGFRVAHHEG